MTTDSEGRIRIDMTPSEAYEFIRLLSEDDDLREDLESDPQAVLNRHGISIPPDILGIPVKLPDKREIAKIASLASQDRFGLGRVVRAIEALGEFRYDFLGEFRLDPGDTSRNRDPEQDGPR